MRNDLTFDKKLHMSGVLLALERDSLKAQLAEARAEIKTLREENAQLCGYDSYEEQEKTLAGQEGE